MVGMDKLFFKNIELILMLVMLIIIILLSYKTHFSCELQSVSCK